MRDARPIRVFAYDIASDNRRARVARILEEQTVRVQESVFEARLTHREVEQILHALARILLTEDRLRVYTVPDRALPECHALGGTPIAELEDYWLL